jgi:hypothetical protein
VYVVMLDRVHPANVHGTVNFPLLDMFAGISIVNAFEVNVVGTGAWCGGTRCWSHGCF